MTRAESLRKLNAWAHWHGLTPTLANDSMREAQRHGLAAVRAMRALADNEIDRHWQVAEESFARSESRLAVRAALNACGIHGAL